MGIYYNPNMASVFNAHVDDAITQLKSAGSTMNSLLKKEFPSKTIIGRRFNNNKSDLENINTTIRDTYKKYLPNIRGDVVAQVLRYEAATQDVYRYMTNMGTYEYKNVKKKKWEDMTDAEKMWERGKMELWAGFAGRAETVWDGILVHVGEGADGLSNFFDYIGATGAESYFDSIGAKCAKSIETDYWGTWRQDQIEMRGMGDDFKWFGDIMYDAGGIAFDITADIAMTAAGVPPVGGVVYSYLTETGESAQDMYRSKNINVNDKEDRANVNSGAIMIGAINGSADYASGKIIGGMNAESLHGAIFKKGGISAITGAFKTTTKRSIEKSVTGDDQFDLDLDSMVIDGILTFIISGKAGSNRYKQEDLEDALQNATEKATEGTEKFMEKANTYGDDESYSDKTNKLLKTANEKYNEISEKSDKLSKAEEYYENVKGKIKKSAQKKGEKVYKKAKKEYEKVVKEYEKVVEEYKDKIIKPLESEADLLDKIIDKNWQQVATKRIEKGVEHIGNAIKGKKK